MPFTSNIDVAIHRHIDVGYAKPKGVKALNALGKLEKMLMAGEITEEQYRERKAAYVETILDLYIKGIIDKEQMQEKLNQ